MTHAPPVPSGNQSPYPIAEPPHPKSAAPDPGEARDRAPAKSGSTSLVERLPTVEPRTAYIGAIAVVAAGAVAGLFYALTGRKQKPAAKPTPPKPRRTKATTARRKPRAK